MLLACEQAIAVTAPVPTTNCSSPNSTRPDRKIDVTTADRRRSPTSSRPPSSTCSNLHRRSSEVAGRLRDLQARRDSVGAERTAGQRELLRLLIEDVHVTGRPESIWPGYETRLSEVPPKVGRCPRM